MTTDRRGQGLGRCAFLVAAEPQPLERALPGKLPKACIPGARLTKRSAILLRNTIAGVCGCGGDASIRPVPLLAVLASIGTAPRRVRIGADLEPAILETSGACGSADSGSLRPGVAFRVHVGPLRSILLLRPPCPHIPHSAPVLAGGPSPRY